MAEKNGSDEATAEAWDRYKVISAFLAIQPPRGERLRLLETLAKKMWTDCHGEPMSPTAETLRTWVRNYQKKGLPGLMDKKRERRGVGVLDAEQCELLCRVKKEVPERSLDAIIRICEDLELFERGVLCRSTVHRVLSEKGLSARPRKAASIEDLDRFEAAHPNDLWQSDMLEGPWLPDPERPGKVRRAHLYTFLDDHSRLMLHGCFSFKENLPTLELVLRRAIQKWGKFRRLYYDNGQVYRANHMQQIVASMGAHRITYTQAYRPEGHGKIEAFNRAVRGQFLCELKTSSVRTIDELNEAFRAWSDLFYNAKVHTETGQTPLERWRAGADRVKYVEQETLRQAFLWKEERTPDKTGVFSLLGTRYQVGAGQGRRKLQVRFDPESMQEVEIWRADKFIERSRPLQIGTHRRPVSPTPVPLETVSAVSPPPAADWLGHLARKARENPLVQAANLAQLRAAKDQAIIDLLASRLAPSSFDDSAARAFLARFGPFDPARATTILDNLLSANAARDLHVGFYLDFIRTCVGSPTHD
jgi:transposase InsO family protein